MNKTILIGLAALVALAACVSVKEESRAGGPPFDPKNPRVYVVTYGTKKAIVVDQEPIYFFRGHGTKVPVVWHLVTPGYSFKPANGITQPVPITGPAGQVHSCRAQTRQTYGCINENTATGRYKYAINVSADDGSGDPAPLDPIIGND